MPERDLTSPDSTGPLGVPAPWKAFVAAAQDPELAVVVVEPAAGASGDPALEMMLLGDAQAVDAVLRAVSRHAPGLEHHYDDVRQFIGRQHLVGYLATSADRAARLYAIDRAGFDQLVALPRRDGLVPRTEAHDVREGFRSRRLSGADPASELRGARVGALQTDRPPFPGRRPGPRTVTRRSPP